ncbi:MAG: efflux RND transporter periplasmic adaptor subunit [Chloroflexi bacterium]|nr:efflux RND transporter periplasmic adaptor subunit [Chloroflexota bacterium]
MFNRKTRLVATLTIIVLGVTLLTVGCQSLSVSASTATQPTPTSTTPANQLPVAQPTAVSPMTIQVMGMFVAPNQAALTFKGGGRITELSVQEGATVKKGDTLALLDTVDLQLAVLHAQAAFAGAQARLSQAKSPANDADIAAAQAVLDAAQKNYDKVRAGPTANQLVMLKAQAENAKATVDQAQAAYDRIGGASNPFIAMTPQSATLQQATNNYKAALATANDAATHPTDVELATAQAQLQQAQAARARLAPTADNIAAAQAQVDQAKAALALAQQQVTNATLTAPFDGTVIWIGPHAGETVGPTTPIATLADLTHLQLQGNLDQIFLGQIQVGQVVMIVPDAFKGKTVTGKVSRIGWLAATTAGVTNVPVTIDVDSSDVPLRPGLSATAQILLQNQ